MTLPPVTFELAHRLEDAALHSASPDSRRSATGPRKDSTSGSSVGAAIAPASPAQPELDFVNRIEGFGIGDAARLDQILDFYGSLGIDPWLELAPEAGVAAASATTRWKRCSIKKRKQPKTERRARKLTPA